MLKYDGKKQLCDLFLLPILTTLLALSLSFSGNNQAKIGILDKDHSRISKQFVAQLKQTKKYDVFTKIEENHIDNYLWENYNIMDDVAAGDYKRFDQLLQKNKSLNDHVQQETLADRSRSKSVSSTTTGFLLILMLGSTSVIYGGILTDKSSQIYNRLVLSRLSRFQYMLSYVCVGLVAFTIQIAIMFSLLKIFNVSFYIPTPMLLLIFFLFSLLEIGFGLLIGAVTQNTQQSSQLANLIVMPTSMLAGCLWPLSITPSYMQAIGKLLPQNWVLSAIAVFQSGGSLAQVGSYLLAMLVTAVAFITLSSFLLKLAHS
ncbi:transport permease yfiM [Streptococcus dysgalactiae subsp. dysgalactiae]|nr:transport permease yfiM [Streptococcus dysgalactiae subsp. dysgalactiae]